MAIKTRIGTAKNNKLCIKCLKTECHVSKSTSRACLKCFRKHYTLHDIEIYKLRDSNKEGASRTQKSEQKYQVRLSTTNISNNEVPSVNCVSPMYYYCGRQGCV